jgi:hypothetical protein
MDLPGVECRWRILATYGDAEPEFLEITEGLFIAAMGLGHHPPS